MANLVSLTTIEQNRLTGVGTYLFNTSRIKRVTESGSGSLIYYSAGSDKQSGLIKIKVSNSKTVVDASLAGFYDDKLSLSVLSINGKDEVRTETVRLLDILCAQTNGLEATYSNVWIDSITGKTEYKVNNTLASILSTANTYDSSNILTNTKRTGAFVPATGIQLDREAGTFYDPYTQTGALALFVPNTNVVGGGAILPIVVNGNTITPSVSMQNDPASDTPSTTPGETVRYSVWEDGTGIWYKITNMGVL